MRELEEIELFKIYCGRGIPPKYQYELSRKAFYEFLDKHNCFENVSIWECVGYWKKHRENTFVLDVGDANIDQIKQFCEEYVEEFEQENIWITQTKIQGGLLK